MSQRTRTRIGKAQQQSSKSTTPSAQDSAHIASTGGGKMSGSQSHTDVQAQVLALLKAQDERMQVLEDTMRAFMSTQAQEVVQEVAQTVVTNAQADDAPAREEMTREVEVIHYPRYHQCERARAKNGSENGTWFVRHPDAHDVRTQWVANELVTKTGKLRKRTRIVFAKANTPKPTKAQKRMPARIAEHDLVVDEKTGKRACTCDRATGHKCHAVQAGHREFPW